jgi:hypothetical protein
MRVLLGGEVDWHLVSMGADAPWQPGLRRPGPPLEPTHYQMLGVGEQVVAADIAAAVERFQAVAIGDPKGALAIAVLTDPWRRKGYDAYLHREREALVQAELRRRLRRRLAAAAGAAAALALLAWLFWGD